MRKKNPWVPRSRAEIGSCLLALALVSVGTYAQAVPGSLPTASNKALPGENTVSTLSVDSSWAARVVLGREPESEIKASKRVDVLSQDLPVAPKVDGPTIPSVLVADPDAGPETIAAPAPDASQPGTRPDFGIVKPGPARTTAPKPAPSTPTQPVETPSAPVTPPPSPSDPPTTPTPDPTPTQPPTQAPTTPPSTTPTAPPTDAATPQAEQSVSTAPAASEAGAAEPNAVAVEPTAQP